MLRDNQPHFFVMEFSRVILITEQDLENAYDFAKRRMRDEYADSNQTGPHRLKQFQAGCIVEHGAYRYFPGLPPPDLKYHDKSKKSWAPDFTLDGMPIACKGQWLSAAKKYGMSWTYQRNSTVGRKDTSLAKPQGVQVYGVVDDLNPRCVEIKAVVNSADIFPSHLDDPKVERLKSSKWCVYYAELENSIKLGRVKDLTYALKTVLLNRQKPKEIVNA